jgi:hypothetical protein
MRYLPADISYGIQCAVEGCDITPDVAAFFYDFNDRNISAEHDALDNYEINWQACHRRYADLYTSVYEDWYYNRATEPQKIWCILASLDRYASRIGEQIDYLYRRYVSQCLADGSDYTDLNTMATYLQQEEIWTHVIRNTTSLTNRINALEATMLQTGMANRSAVYMDAQVVAIQNSYVQNIQMMQDEIVTAFERITTPSDRIITANNRRKYERSRRIKQKQSRKVLKKSSSFLSRLLGRQHATAFIRGNEIRVEGRQYDFLLKKTNLLTTGHGGFRISVYARDTGARMVDLCWYIPDTPALDQLAALVMAVKAGEEDEIIEIGNHLSITQEAREHPVFSKSLPEPGTGFNMLNGNFTINGNILTVGNTAVQEDQMMRFTAGTVATIQSNAAAYTQFVDCANSTLNVIQTTSIPERFRLRSGGEIRHIVNNQVGDIIPENWDEPTYTAETLAANLNECITVLQETVDARQQRLIAA